MVATQSINFILCNHSFFSASDRDGKVFLGRSSNNN